MSALATKLITAEEFMTMPEPADGYAALSENAQVLCVTHLAQVAACARTQVVVRKGDQGGRTVARATIVDGEDRLSELSRMLAGVEDSDHARGHAEELLSRAGAAAIPIVTVR